MNLPAPSLPHEVFLSHSHEDREIAEAITSVLRSHGVPVWYSPASIMGAQQWHDEIGLALERCDWFCFFLPPTPWPPNGLSVN
jgi:hypothetical protein